MSLSDKFRKYLIFKFKKKYKKIFSIRKTSLGYIINLLKLEFTVLLMDRIVLVSMVSEKERTMGCLLN